MLIPHPLIRQFFIFFIVSTLSLSIRAESNLSSEKENDVNTGAVQKTSNTEGTEEVFGVESISRSEAIYPSNYGQAGLFRVRSAESLPENALSFGLGGEFYAVGDAPVGGSANTIAESLFIGYSPVSHLTLAVMRRDSSTTYGQPAQLISSLGDFNFSAMYSVPLNQSFALAPIFDFSINSNFNNLAPNGSTVSAGVGAAATYSFFPAFNLPLFAHANVIYHSAQMTSPAPAGLTAEAYYNFSRFSTVTLALGAEYKLGNVIPFFEVTDLIEAGSPLPFGGYPSKLSLGARFTPLSNKSVAFLLGGDVGLGRGLAIGVPYSPGYQIIGQISYTVGVTQTERKHYFTTKDVNVVDRKFIIGKSINFKVASSELEPDSHRLLDQIASVIKENHIKKLLIVGHTDSTHTDDYNVKLSQDRASSVKKYLITQGVPEEVLMIQGYGRRRPRASNLTEEGRALNRRVEFYILD